MIRALASEEIDRVLRAQIVGRIGCHTAGQTYVVPVCYAYESNAIYAHSRHGLKIDMMRQNPYVCFEVDHVEDLVNWDSAICWATYEELSGADAEHGLELIRERIEERLPRVVENGVLAAEEADGGEEPIVFRLNVTEASGREERLYWELLPVAPGATTQYSPASSPTWPAERWLSHEQAQDLAEISAVLDARAIWDVADKLAEHRPSEEVAASLVYRGAQLSMARRIVEFLRELRDDPGPERKSNERSTSLEVLLSSPEFIPDDVRSELGTEELAATFEGEPEDRTVIPEDVLAERDADARARAWVPGDEAAPAELFD
jgi:nitroimidazol reductase NimA-like FMN-containing flavoprotein (pyridoxamine 5'-phosphate oxidase superfamily)